MKCPACYSELRSVQIGKLTVDICADGCGGIWFDAFELQQVDEAHEVAGERLLEFESGRRIQVDARRKRACPRCDEVKLKRRFFSPRRQIEIDECPGCGGCWLDADELGKIRAITEQNRVERETRRPYLTGSVVRYLYELRIERRVED